MRTELRENLFLENFQNKELNEYTTAHAEEAVLFLHTVKRVVEFVPAETLERRVSWCQSSDVTHSQDSHISKKIHK